MNHRIMDHFVSPSQPPVCPNIAFALRTLRIAIERNPDCSRHMLQGVVQILRRIYYLPTENNDEPQFVIPQQTAITRKLAMIQRWVIQWSQRGPIDAAIEEVRTIFDNVLLWSQHPTIRDNMGELIHYINNVSDIYADEQGQPSNITVRQMLRSTNR